MNRAVELRPMRLEDVTLLERWDDDPDVSAALGGAGADWYDWPAELVRDVAWRELLIVEDDGRPVGFVQLLDAHRDESGYWGPVPPGTWAVDIWIGSPADRGRGMGSAAMRTAMRRAFERHDAGEILIDPRADNERAVAFYRRLGFGAVEERVLDGDRCLVMRFPRPPDESVSP